MTSNLSCLFIGFNIAEFPTKNIYFSYTLFKYNIYIKEMKKKYNIGDMEFKTKKECENFTRSFIHKLGCCIINKDHKDFILLLI